MHQLCVLQRALTSSFSRAPRLSYHRITFPRHLEAAAVSAGGSLNAGGAAAPEKTPGGVLVRVRSFFTLPRSPPRGSVRTAAYAALATEPGDEAPR
jgi:hypothetical protein